MTDTTTDIVPAQTFRESLAKSRQLSEEQLSEVKASEVREPMALASLYCDFKAERDTQLLRSRETLKTINDLPAAEFWKKVEAGRRKDEEGCDLSPR